MIIVDPPGEPVTKKGLSSLKTITGVMEDNGVFFGSILFASDPIKPYTFGDPGLEEKSSISLFIKIPVPVGTMPDPYAVLRV